MRHILFLSTFALTVAAQQKQPAAVTVADRTRTEAQALAARGNAAEAVATVARAVERDPRDLESLRLLATLALAAKDPDLAVQALHRWLAAARDVRSLPGRLVGDVEKELTRLDHDHRTWNSLVTVYLRQLAAAAKSLEDRKDLAGALALHRATLRLNPDSAAAKRAVAALGGTPAAGAQTVPSATLKELEGACRARPDDREAARQLAKHLDEMGDRARAAGAHADLLRLLAVEGEVESPAWTEALGRWQALDPGIEHHGKARSTFLGGALALARRYETSDMPRMALQVALAASCALDAPEAFAYAHELGKRARKPLCRWSMVYDGESLRGWRAAPGYSTAGETIVTELAGDLPPARPIGVNVPLAAAEPPSARFPASVLLLDAQPTGDFSFEAEMRIAADGRGAYAGAHMGLCFGVKDDANLHAVLLAPTDVLDVATCRAGEWQAHLHRPWWVGNAWVRVRIDVIGIRVDLYCDGALVHSQDLPSLDSVAGSVGLISGAGRASMRNVRFLARSAGDGEALLERALARGKRAAGNGTRPSSLLGIEPPVLQARAWVQGEPIQLGDLRGKPAVLAFWSVEQDREIPCIALFNDLLQRGKAAGLALVLFCDGGSDEDAVRAYLTGRPLPTARVAVDDGNLTLGAYGVNGLPQILLLDADGRVVFQGSANLERTGGWSGGGTALDEPLRTLLGK